MLNFFRKHQRIFFIFITIVIVTSFAFFGTFSSYMQEERAPDRQIGKKLDGSPLMEREIEAMKRLLSEDFLTKNVLETGFGSLLVQRHFEQIKPDLEERLKRARVYQTYVHPQASFIRAENIWKHFVPGLLVHLEQFKAADPSPEAFALLCHLFQDQMQFSPQLLQHFLASQQSQYSWIVPDPELSQGNLSLFGYRTGEEWFGKQFMDLLAQSIIQISVIAQQKGYQVTKEEAWADLLERRIDPRFLGLDENGACKVWQHALLFQRLSQDVGESVVIDKITTDAYASYVNEAVEIDLFELPQELQLKDFHSLLKLQAYLDAVAPKPKGNMLALPRKFYSLSEIEKRAPYLVQKRYQVEFSAASKEEIALGVSLKETWDWQLDETHFNTLKISYPILGLGDSATREGRLNVLDKLDPETRLAVDRFTREQIVAAHPEWVEAALQKAEMKKQEVCISLEGGTIPFEGIADREALIDQLDTGFCAKLTQDNLHYYRVKVLSSTPKEILPFAQAHSKQVKDKEAYADLLKAIEEDYRKQEKKEPPAGLDFYAHYRLAAHLREAKNQEKNKEEGGLENQWQLQKSRRIITRGEKAAFPKEELFQLKSGQWSKVSALPTGQMFLYQVIGPALGHQKYEAVTSKALQREAKQMLFKQLLDQISAKE